MAATIIRTDQFAEWLDSLRDRQGQQRLAIAIARLANGHGVTKSVGGGVREVKLSFGPGYRLYYTMRGDELIVLLCGGDKSTQSRDVATAKELAARLE